MFQLLFLVFCSVYALDFEHFLNPENSFSFDHHSPSFTGISPQCLNDSRTWIRGIKSFYKEAVFCAATWPKCPNKTKRSLETNFYALKQLDAFGKLPAGILDLTLVNTGSYQECQEVGDHYVYPTHFCYLSGKFGKDCSKPMTMPFRSAVCMPKSCSERDLPLLFNALGYSRLTYCSAQCVQEHIEQTTFFWIFSAILGVLIFLTLLSTIVDYVLHNIYPQNVINKGIQAFLAFSLYTNGSLVLDTRPARDGHIKCIDCIRFFSIMWVIAGHVEQKFLANDTLWPLTYIGNSVLSLTVTNAVFSVDTFFVLSGILVAYMFFKASPKLSVIKSPVTWVMFYVHRYLRLTPPYLLIIGFLIAYGPYISGPQTISTGDNLGRAVATCEKYWWTNILYITNFFNQNDQLCYGVGWYLTVDMQLYLVTPIFLFMLSFSHVLGVITLLSACVGSITATFVLIYKYDLAVSQVVVDSKQSEEEFTSKLYRQPWIRCTPYLIGIYFGYFLAVFRNKKIRMHPLFAIALWCFFAAVALSCLYGPHNYFDFHDQWSKFTRSCYYSFSRIGWAMAVCWVVVANHRGWGGPIAQFMEHPLWQPLGRLSYCVYLIHYIVRYYYYNLLDGPVHLTSLWQTYIYFAVPITAISYFFAFFWSCICEIPFIKLEKMGVDSLMKAFCSKKKNSKENREEPWLEKEERAKKL